MTQEEKNLLLKDLCARLPYGVMIKEEYGDYINVNLYNAHLEHLIDRISDGLDKLVLRSLSSMTEEEFLEYHDIKYNKVTYRRNWKRFDVGKYRNVGIIPIEDYLVWLLEHHFDFMGLIPKGLAIEVTKDNNPYE